MGQVLECERNVSVPDALPQLEIDPVAWIGITQVLARYGHIIDDAAWDRFGDVFTEDVYLDYRDVGNEIMRGHAEAASGFAAMRHPLGHHTTNAFVEAISEDGDRYRVRSKWIIGGRQGEARSGNYEDEFIRQERKWLIAKRIATRKPPPTEQS
jgi:hypothetical protein